MSSITKEFREAALRRGTIVRSNSSAEPASDLIKNATVASLLQLGFIVDPKMLSGFTQDALVDLVSDARQVSGASKDMKPVYPGFPAQVKATPVLTLILDQITHYLTGGKYFPNVPNPEREGLPLADWFTAARKVQVESAGKVALTYLEYVSNKGVAISPDEVTLLNESAKLVTDADFSFLILNSKNQENMQRLAHAAPGNPADLIKKVGPQLTNSDALLRLILVTYTLPVKPEFEEFYQKAVYTLAKDSEFALNMVSMPRSVRTTVLKALGGTTKGFKADSLVHNRQVWQHVMRMVHPFALPASKTSSVRRALNIIHENEQHVTLNGVLDSFLEAENAAGAIKVVSENSPQLLLTSLVRILRTAKPDEVDLLVKAISEKGQFTTLRTLISAYNGVISANIDALRVTRIAGRGNSLTTRKDIVKIDKGYIVDTTEAIKVAITNKLKTYKAPNSPVGTKSTVPVPLFNRDSAVTDKQINRGERLTPVGNGRTLRLFSHWLNTGARSGYVDLAGVFLDKDFNTVNVVTWNSWAGANDVATYSGDTCVQPGHSAVEFIDIELDSLKSKLPEAKWIAMTLISYSGPKLGEMDIYAGVMYRSDADKGEIFDPRTVVSASSPKVPSSQSVVLAVNIETGETVWVDSSSGTDNTGLSAASDSTIGPILYDEIVRPRLTLGELSALWAAAHNAEVTDEPVETSAVLQLL